MHIWIHPSLENFMGCNGLNHERNQVAGTWRIFSDCIVLLGSIATQPTKKRPDTVCKASLEADPVTSPTLVRSIP